MSLKVVVEKARDLPNVDRYSKSDPFTIITYQGQNKKTKVIDNNLDPEWNEELSWEVPGGISADEALQVDIYDHETIGRNRLLGSTDVPLRDVLSSGQTRITKTLTGKHGERLTASIDLELKYEAPSTFRGGVGVTSSETDEKETEATVVERSEYEVDDDGSSGRETISDGTRKIAERRSNFQKGSGAYQIHQSRHKLPNKPTDFQVRVHVLEARKLVGTNLNTAVKVICGVDIQQTSTQKGTDKPVFDEVLFFNFRDHPDKVFDHITEFKVCNANLISNALIGSFKFDLGLVYNEVEHCFTHKWLLLTDPRDPSGGTKGYLKISIQVLAPGDTPKSSPSQTEFDKEHVDIEVNLLRPLGVCLVPATLIVRVFCAEDLPQMDPGYFEGVKKLLRIGTAQKELVDPYCSVTFAGHKGTTQVVWNEKDPKWNKQINLGVQFPSMCERIRLRLKDKDKVNQDDYIGTCYLHMSDISSPGENGFLPTFGPCFINCFGSPREFSALPDKYEHLNKGLIEGVAYRGRVMIEVGMSLGRLPTTKTEDINAVDLKRLTPFLRKRKYKLFGTFFSATMVCPSDQPVEFEVSIGNYGNKMDESSPAQPSTTPPSTPIYDGTQYYYLPWWNKKPVIQIDSQWEDCSYRVESVNLILHNVDSLKECLDSVKNMMEKKNFDILEIKDKLRDELDSFNNDIYQSLPKLPDNGFTQLDKLMRERRAQGLANLREECDTLRTNLNDHSLSEIIVEIEDYIAHLKSMATEPQNSIPDVVIWMLSNNKRVAVKRIPSHELMYAIGKCRGKNCGKLQTIYLTPPAVKDEKELKDLQVGAQVRLQLWLGLEKNQDDWTRGCCAAGEVEVFAETYENETRSLFNQWTKIGLGTKPHWSDAMGKVEQPKEAFNPPPGWAWVEKDWEVKPDESVLAEPDEGRDEWTEDVFENQTRRPLSPWPDQEESASFWTDVHGTKLVKCEGKEEKEISRDEISPPDGWVFKDDKPWMIDMNRAVDEEGWEYTPEFGLNKPSYLPSERNIHLSRRRRWIRVRFRDSAVEMKRQNRSIAIKEGWEYASLGSNSFHIRKGRLDTVRRRRHIRKLVQVGGKPGAIAVLNLGTRKKDDKKKKKGDDGADEKWGKQIVPRMHIQLKECHTYQLRAYLYQARDMYSGDSTGLSDPYAIMCCGHYSTRSRVMHETLCPTWNQTMIIRRIRLFSDTKSVCDSPPPVVFEFFDKDLVGEDDFLGKSVVIPTVHLTLDVLSPRLDWVEIVRYNKHVGEALIACELLLNDGGELPVEPPRASAPPQNYIVPDGIRPVLKKMRIEILCWGLRDMKHYLWLPITSPLVEIECGGITRRSQHIKDTKTNPKFEESVISFDVYLPEEELYCPPLNIRIFDKRMFGHQPMIGIHVVKALKDFYVDEQKADANDIVLDPPPTLDASFVQDGQVAIDIDMDAVVHAATKIDSDPDTKYSSDYDWWTKYYYSIEEKSKIQPGYAEEGHDRLKVYKCELEESFNNFTDFVQTFALHRGRGSRDPEDKIGKPVGYFKGAVKAYPVSEDAPEPAIPNLISSNMSIRTADQVDLIVRVYIIKGIDLQPRDSDGKSDPYIKVKIGKKVIDDKESYIPGSLNPIFGKMFELPATLPLDHTLTISVMDWDRFSADDLIGETKIDVENRFLSCYRATCGLPESFSERGSNRWRDMDRPSEILDDWIKSNGLPEAEWSDDGKSVTVGDKVHTLEEGKVVHPEVSEQTKHCLALQVLRQKNLVPEHIETRNLYNPMQPGISQGQLHMWMDIFRKQDDIPPPIDVSPRKPQKYELRIVVWNSKVSVKSTTDIYVKGWLRGEDDAQKTDVHYRSLDGEGNFNWRFVFPLEYLPAENVMVVKKKEHFYSLTKVERHLPPMLTMQVWDNDVFTPDDFLGTVDFDLSSMPLPVKRSRNCNLRQLDESKAKTDNLFKRKRMEGWWPIHATSKKGNLRTLKGKVELEFEILTEEESLLHPAAKARNEPNQNPKLDPPNRPKTSFFWLSSPWKSFRYIIWKEYKGRIIGLILLVLLLLPIIALLV